MGLQWVELCLYIKQTNKIFLDIHKIPKHMIYKVNYNNGIIYSKHYILNSYKHVPGFEEKTTYDNE